MAHHWVPPLAQHGQSFGQLSATVPGTGNVMQQSIPISGIRRGGQRRAMSSTGEQRQQRYLHHNNHQRPAQVYRIGFHLDDRVR